MKQFILLVMLISAITISNDIFGRTRISDGSISVTCAKDLYGNTVCR
jgi:hypothetical protein